MKVIETESDDHTTIIITIIGEGQADPFDHPPLDFEQYDREKARQEAIQLAYEAYYINQ